MLRFIGIPYGYWVPGERLWSDFVPTMEQARQHGIICADVPNIFRLACKLPLEPMRGILKGGTEWWEQKFDLEKYRYVPGKVYPKWTLFGTPYHHPTRQGHVTVTYEKDDNPPQIQSNPGIGVNRKFRLSDMVEGFPKYAVPASTWLK